MVKKSVIRTTVDVLIKYNNRGKEKIYIYAKKDHKTVQSAFFLKNNYHVIGTSNDV